MMEEIKPKKERKFLKAMGDIALTLFWELVLGIGKKVINKVGNKRQGLVISFVILASTFAIAQFPNTGNKQRLGFQTTADGLVWRGALSDTASIQPINNQSAWVILDTVNLKIYSFDFTSNVWNLVGGGGAAFTQPVDSLFFNTGVPTNNVDTAKMRWDSDLATVVLGLNDNVPNELGFKNFWLVKNQTGSTITKGSLVYANGTVGASGRITVDKFIANGSIDAKYLLGITAHDLTDGEDGYVISYGKIRQVNTDTFAAGAILYPSPTVAGVWTDVEPIAPNIDMPIGFCINSSVNNGTIAIRVASGYKLSELHDVSITSPLEKASLYYSGGLWRDTTAALLVSDTASMLSNYATKAYADTTGRLYARQDFTNVSSSTLTWTQSDTLIPGGVIVVQVYRNGQILLPSQYTIPTSTSVIIAASSFKVNDNYTVIFPRGGGAGSGGGSGSLTSISAGTGITVSPNPITTTGTVSADLSVLMELTDTSLLNLTTRFASKLNTTDTASLSNRIDAKGTGTVTSVGNGYGLLSNQSPITTSGVIRVDSSTVYNYVRDSIVKVRIGNDTIKILKQEYNNVITDTLTWTTTNKFPIQLRAFILLFRNGQLLINDQYSVIDTNKIKIAATSYKVGENYTLVTVSGIGSAGVSQTGNPIYPEAGIAVSTGTTWTTSIPDNSTNWNTAFTDRLKWDGGSTGLTPSTGRTSLGGTTIGQSMFTLTNPSAITFPRFNADNTVNARSAANFRSDIGAGTVTEVDVAVGTPISITNKTTTPVLTMNAATGSVNGYLTSNDWSTFNSKQSSLINPVTGTGSNDFIPKFTSTGSTIGNSVIQESSGNIGIGTTPIANLTFDVSKNILLKSGSTGIASILFSETGTPSSTDVEFGGILRYNGNLDRMELITRDNLGGSNVTNTGLTMDRITGNIGLLKPTTISSTLAVTGNITEGGNNVLTNLDTASLSSRIDSKQNALTLTTTGTSGAATLIGATLNIPQYSGGGSSGTVTSVGLTAPSIFTVSGSPVTTSGTLALTYSGTALPLLNGGTGATTADGALTNLGASAMGKSLFGLTNSVSDKFIKVNTDNTITLLNAADTRTAIGATIRGANNFTLPDIGSISFLRYNADNSITQLNAADFRTAITAVSAVTASGPLASTGGLTPNISIGEASSTTTGIVNVQAQSFAGLKTFVNGIVTPTISLNYSTARTTNAALSTYTVQGNDNFIIFNRFGTVTLTLPNAATFSGRLIYLKTVQGNVISNSANVVPLIGGNPGQAILDATAGKWCTLLSDGTYWNIMQAN